MECCARFLKKLDIAMDYIPELRGGSVQGFILHPLLIVGFLNPRLGLLSAWPCREPSSPGSSSTDVPCFVGLGAPLKLWLNRTTITTVIITV